MPHDALFLPLPVFFFEVGTLVVELFAFGQANFKLCPAACPMQVKWDEGVASAFDFSDQGGEFLAVHEQLAGARGVGNFMRAGLFEWREVGANQKCFPSLEHDVGFGDLCATGAQAFDFPALQHQPGFVAFLDVIIMARASVDRDGAVVSLVSVGFFLCHPLIIGERRRQGGLWRLMMLDRGDATRGGTL